MSSGKVLEVQVVIMSVETKLKLQVVIKTIADHWITTERGLPKTKVKVLQLRKEDELLAIAQTY